MFESRGIPEGYVDIKDILGSENMVRGYIVIRGLEFGDEGKGSMADYFSQDIVIKEGGPQAAHHNVSKDGKLHCCKQMGSGIFNSGARTFASVNMLINPANLIKENLALYQVGVYDGMKRLAIDSRCAIVTPLHQMMGRMLEISRGSNRHGSTGMGVGQAANDRKLKGEKVLSVGDMLDEEILEEKIADLFSEKFKEAEMLLRNNPGNKELSKVYRYYSNSLSSKLLFNSYRGFAQAYPATIIENGEEHFTELIRSGKSMVFEGSQGALLDPEFGFKPYVTKTKTTFETAEELLAGRVPRSEIEKIGVMRAYSTRHGAGPFVTENKALSWMILDMHNKTNPWQGKFRIGWLDLLAARYGILVNKGVDSMALTNLDRLSRFSNIRVCTSYEYLGKNESELDSFFEWENSGDKIRIIAFKKPKQPQDERISSILFECKPMNFERLPGWKTSIESAKTKSDLPKEAIRYVNFLQSKEGLGNEISIVSVGPTSENKILYNSC